MRRKHEHAANPVGQCALNRRVRHLETGLEKVVPARPRKRIPDFLVGLLMVVVPCVRSAELRRPGNQHRRALTVGSAEVDLTACALRPELVGRAVSDDGRPRRGEGPIGRFSRASAAQIGESSGVEGVGGVARRRRRHTHRHGLPARDLMPQSS